MKPEIIALLFATILIGFFIIFHIVSAIGLWKIFQKSGTKGWYAFIPFFNLIIVLKIIGRSVWLFLLFLGLYLLNYINFTYLNLSLSLSIITLIGFIFLGIPIATDLAKSFGKSNGYGIAIFFFPFIFLPALGFSPASYRGPAHTPEVEDVPVVNNNDENI
jgi:hypothetical protein